MTYRVYQGFRPNLGKRTKMVICGSLLTTFKVSGIFKAAGTGATIGMNLKSNHQIKSIKLKLFKSLIHIVLLRRRENPIEIFHCFT